MVLGLYVGARIEEVAAPLMKDVDHRLGTYWVTLRTDKGNTRQRVVAVVNRYVRRPKAPTRVKDF
jgi:hypothetical protein